MVLAEFPCVVLWRPEALDCRVLIPPEAWNGLTPNPPSLGFEPRTSRIRVYPSDNWAIGDTLLCSASYLLYTWIQKKYDRDSKDTAMIAITALQVSNDQFTSTSIYWHFRMLLRCRRARVPRHDVIYSSGVRGRGVCGRGVSNL